MITDLTTTNDLTNEIAIAGSDISKILTRAGDKNALQFKCINKEKLNEIAKFIPEINRACNVFGKGNSQTTSMLMSLNMLDGNAYRRLKQISAQIERKRSALKENIFKLQKSEVEYDILKQQMDNETDPLKRELLYIEQQEKASGAADSKIYIEAAIKEIGLFMEAYKEICKNNNIPENWDEADYEEAEIEHHIKMMFTMAIRDLGAGQRMNVGTCEYFEQFGIMPAVGYALAARFLQSVTEAISADKAPSIDMQYAFLDEMYNMFKEEYKRAMKRLGLDKVIHGDWIYQETKTGQL